MSIDTRTLGPDGGPLGAKGPQNIKLEEEATSVMDGWAVEEEATSVMDGWAVEEEATSGMDGKAVEDVAMPLDGKAAGDGATPTIEGWAVEDEATPMMDGKAVVSSGIRDRSESTGNQSQFDDYGTEHASSSGNLGAQATGMLEQLAINFADSASEKRVEKPQTDDDICAICTDPILGPRELPCGHRFCTGCIRHSFEKYQPRCPTCGRVCGVVHGNQPNGMMSAARHPKSLPGYEDYQTLVIEYTFPNGIQNDKHPNPGRPYYGTYEKAYLPDSPEGWEVYGLLYKAFEARLIFTVGRSTTTGLDDQVIWSDIHLKTKFTGVHGYPDPGHLARVKEELKAKGIVPNNSAENHYCNLL